MWAKLAVFWNSLPHWLQAIIVLFAATAGGAIAKEFSDPNACMMYSCISSDFVGALRLGIAAVCGLYVKSSLYQR